MEPQEDNYDFLLRTSGDSFGREKENLSSPPSLSHSALTDLGQFLQSLCKTHLESVRRLFPSQPDSGLPPIDETEEDDASCKQSAQAEVARAKACVSGTLQRDLKLLSLLQRPRGEDSAKTHRMQEELRASHGKLAAVIQENQELRNMLADAKKRKGDETECSAQLAKEMEELRQEVSARTKDSSGEIADEIIGEVKKMLLSSRKLTTATEDGGRLKTEKTALEKKYRELSSHLNELSEAMELVETTNKELMTKIEQQERENAAARKRYQTLEGEMSVKNQALEKAQKVIQELYQDSRRAKKQVFDIANASACTQTVECSRKEEGTIEVSIAAGTNSAIARELEQVRQSDAREIARLQQSLDVLRQREVQVQSEYESSIQTLKNAVSNVCASRTQKSPDPFSTPLRSGPNQCIITTCSRRRTEATSKPPAEPVPETKAAVCTSPREDSSGRNTVESETQTDPEQREGSALELLLAELERGYKTEYECKVGYKQAIETKLEEHRKVMAGILQPIKVAEDEAATVPARNQEIYSLVSELFHTLDQYGAQLKWLSDIVVEKRTRISQLEEENAGLREKVQDLRKDTAELEKMHARSDETDQKCEKAEEDLRTALEELKKCREAMDAMLHSTGTDTAEKAIERIRTLVGTERKCKMMEETGRQTQADVRNVEIMDEMLKEKERMILGLGDEVSKLRSKLELCADKSNQVRALEAKLQTCGQESDQVKQENARLATQLQNTEQTLREERRAWEDRLDEQMDRAACFKSSAEQKELELETLRKHFDNIKETTQQEFEDEVSSLKRALAQQQKEYQGLLESGDRTAELKQKVTNLAKESRDAQERYGRLKSECKTMAAELRACKAAKSEASGSGSMIAETGREAEGSNEIKTLKMIVAEKSNYIAQLEETNNELRKEYELSLKQQLDADDNVFNNLVKGMASAERGPTAVESGTGCERWREELRLAERRCDKYKHKYQKRLKEFEIIMRHVELLLRGEENPEIGREVARICGKNTNIGRWMQDAAGLIGAAATSRLNVSQHYYDFLTYVLESLSENEPKRERAKELLRRVKAAGTKVDAALPEMEKVAAEELQAYVRLRCGKAKV